MMDLQDRPSAAQYKAAAVALMIVAILTSGMIAATWLDGFGGPILILLAISYFLFNFGFLYSAARADLRSKGVRIGILAVLLNVGAMLLASFAPIWTALSVAATVAALMGTFLLFSDANAVAAGEE